MKNMSVLRREHGFSLIELLVVMVIIGLLAGLVGPKLFRHVDTAKQKDAAAQIAMLEEALDLYRLDHHKYPTTEEGLAALKSYLKKDVPTDPWNNPYHYKSPGEEEREYDIVSHGADNSPGGEGVNEDIVSWKSISK
jgi:general secretion pathway protein G